MASFHQVCSPYRVLVVKPDWKTSLERIRCRWEKITKMDLQELGWEGWIVLAEERGGRWALVNAVMNLRSLKNAGKFLTIWESVSLPGRILLHEVSFSKIPDTAWKICRLKYKRYEFDVCVTVHHWYNNIKSQLDATILILLIISISSTCFRR